jgi:diguanylate cyclase (GGDEF)-like protein/PAS domain S-box-containing protein
MPFLASLTLSLWTPLLGVCIIVGGVAVLIGLRNLRLARDVREKADEFHSLIDATPDAFVSIDEEAHVTEWNPRAEAMFGWSRADAMGRSLDEMIVPSEHRGEFRQELAKYVATGSANFIHSRIEAVAMHRSGRHVPVEVSVAPVKPNGHYVINAFICDVSERKEAEAALREAEERFRRAFSDSGIGMAISSPEGRWIAFNTALGELTGYPPDKLLGMRFSDITHPDDYRHDGDVFAELVSGARDVFQGERRYIHADGHHFWVALTVSAIRDETGKTLHLVAQLEDVTERHMAAEALAHQALHDPLTGLPNRTLFDDRASVAVERLRREGGAFAVLFVDLDHFKQVNDGMGHETGDQVLVSVARRLGTLLRGTDTAARFGGDEFTLLCEGVEETAAKNIAGRIVRAFERPFEIDGKDISVGASVGIVLVTDPSEGIQLALRHADAAMYAAKSEGRARWAFYHQASGNGAREHATKAAAGETATNP